MKRAIVLADTRPLRTGIFNPQKHENDIKCQSRYQADFEAGQKIQAAKA
jgi:hypothetical protein